MTGPHCYFGHLGSLSRLPVLEAPIYGGFLPLKLGLVSLPREDLHTPAFLWRAKGPATLSVGTIPGGSLGAKSCPTLVTPWTIACQASLFMGFSRH